MANIAKSEAVLDYIRTHPEEHDQGVWVSRWNACGTKMCFAGTAVMLAGYEFIWGDYDPAATFMCFNPVTRREDQIYNVARDELELTVQQADRLFSANNLDDLELIVKEIANEQAPV